MAPLLAGTTQAAAGELHQCSRCGAPTTGEVCAFCRLRDRSPVVHRSGRLVLDRSRRTDVVDGRCVKPFASASG